MQIVRFFAALALFLALPVIAQAQSIKLAEPPKDWEVVPQRLNNIDQIIYVQTQTKSQMAPNIVVAAKVLDPQQTAEDYYKQGIEQAKQLFRRPDGKTSFVVLEKESKEVTLGGNKAQYVPVQYSLFAQAPPKADAKEKQPPIEVKIKALQYYLTRENTVYLITCTAPASEFEAILPVFDKAVASVEIK